MGSFSCDRCLKQFEREQHLKIHHKRKTPCNYKCTDCGKIFCNKSSLNRHCKAKANKSIDKTIISYGEEKDVISIKDFKDMRLAIMTPSIFICKFIKHIHFNSKYPENHNIYINNIREKSIVLFENGQWVKKDRFFIYSVIKNLISILTDKIEKECPEKINDFGHLVDDIEHCILLKEYENTSLKEVCKSVIHILYNRKQIASGKK